MTTFWLVTDGMSDAHSVRESIRSLCTELKFGGLLRYKKEFSEGHTQTRVLLFEHFRTAQVQQPFGVIFKVGASDLLRDEVERYQKFFPFAARGARKAFVEMCDPERTLRTLTKNAAPSAIAYEFAPSPFGILSCDSLKDLVKNCLRAEGGESVEELESVIKSTITALSSLYAERQSDFAFHILDYYLKHWVPDFQITIERYIKVGEVDLLTLEGREPSLFAQQPTTDTEELRQNAESATKPPTSELVIRPLSCIKASETELKCYSTHTPNLWLRVNTEQLSEDDRKAVMSSTNLAAWAPAGQSRYEFYWDWLRRAFPPSEFPRIDLTSPILQVGKWHLENPLYYLSRPLAESTRHPTKTQMVPTHGDLHPGNVLVVGGIPVIIDYGLSEAALPVGIDAVRLFGGLVRDVLAELLSFEGMIAVLAGVLELSPRPSIYDRRLFRACQLLRTLAQEAKRATGMEAAKWWVHLYGYSWVALKWGGSSEAHRASFLLGAFALTKLFEAIPNNTKTIRSGRSTVVNPRRSAVVRTPAPRSASQADTLSDHIGVWCAKCLHYLDKPQVDLHPVYLNWTATAEGRQKLPLGWMVPIHKDGCAHQRIRGLSDISGITLHDIPSWNDNKLLSKEAEASSLGNLNAAFIINYELAQRAATKGDEPALAKYIINTIRDAAGSVHGRELRRMLSQFKPSIILKRMGNTWVVDYGLVQGNFRRNYGDIEHAGTHYSRSGENLKSLRRRDQQEREAAYMRRVLTIAPSIKGAEEAVRLARDGDPHGLRTAFLHAGWTYFVGEKYDRALDNFNEIFRRDYLGPTSWWHRAGAHFGIGASLYKMKDLKQAVGHCLRAQYISAMLGLRGDLFVGVADALRSDEIPTSSQLIIQIGRRDPSTMSRNCMTDLRQTWIDKRLQAVIFRELHNLGSFLSMDIE